VPRTTELPDSTCAWRLERLLALGFKRVHAEDLATVPDVARDAERLIRTGCCHQVAWLILRD
jgi:hypothetical protein